jgi:hypothetical protein
MRRATTGIAKIIELITHQKADGSPRFLSLAPTKAVPTAARPLLKAIITAINPLVRQPISSTGIVAILKKTAGIMAGARI